jgi:cell division protein FtsI/penicillin-binding protein 2
MKHMRWFKLLLVLAFLVACSPNGGGGFSLGGPTPTKPSPIVSITHAPDAQAAVRTFLEFWKNEDYTSMYQMLTKVSQDTINQDDFTQRYQDTRTNLSLKDLEFEILSTLTNPFTAEVAYRVTFHTFLVGDLQRDMVARLSLESGEWRIQWEDSMIMPELKGGNHLAMDYRIPARGNIYDNQGNAIATQTDVVALGVVPGQIDPKNEGNLVGELSRLTNLTPGTISDLYASAAPDWYVPIGEVTAEEFNRRYNYYTSLGGLSATSYTARYYNGIAPQSVGYVIAIPKEQLDQYQREGYSGNERVGYSGIEKWGEQYLAGKRGGALYVVNKDGQIVTLLASSDPQPADSIYLTLNDDFQRNVQDAISGFRAAAVVIERDTGRVLAIASTPDFDPNFFQPGNPNNIGLTDLLNNPNRPLVNRATQGEYPLGSVFKIITFSAALESGTFTPASTYDCQYDFNELVSAGGPVLHDWTWDHCQNELQSTGECKTQPSGLLTLPEGLMRSCNPWFWHIGLTLYEQGFKTAVSDMARAFGLGTSTGIDQVEEASGNIGNPQSALDATNEAIGQNPVLVTPLQVARFVAAVGNGGTLYRPQMVQKIVDVNGNTIQSFKPEAVGTLPLKPENLKVLQDAMISVVQNPRGTANYRLRGLNIPTAGKTGTAESGVPGSPHAWYAGYTYANIEGVPDIAVAVIVENQGEGSDWAAPMFKRIVESYFYGKPQSLYWWESSFSVTKTPTPLGGIPTETPKP